MTDLTPGIHEFLPAELIELIQQYDHFSITYGHESFMQIRVPTRWVKMAATDRGLACLTCRDKRKRDGHLFEIYGNKFIFDIGFNADRPSGKLKTERCGDEFLISMWNEAKEKER